MSNDKDRGQAKRRAAELEGLPIASRDDYDRPRSNGAHKQPPPDPKPASAPRPLPDPGIGLAELMAKEFPPVRVRAAGVLTDGLTLFAGPPKRGKSWLAFELAIAVAGGFTCLGGRATEQAPVLYLALEDTQRRLKSRAARLLGAREWDAPAGLELRCRSHTSASGGLEALAEWFGRNPGGLVVVDTLQRFREPKRGMDGAYADDYAAMSALHALAAEHRGAVLVVHHTRKGEAEDPFDRVSGTQGIAGAADTVVVMERAGDTGTLYVRGRDIEEKTLTASFDAGVWDITGEAEGAVMPASAGRRGEGERARPGPPPEKRNAAAECVRDFLAAGSRHGWKAIERHARGHGHTPATLIRVREALRLVKHPKTLTCWSWSLPEGFEAHGGERGTAAGWLAALLASKPLAASRVQKEAKKAGLTWRSVQAARAELGVKVEEIGTTTGTAWALPGWEPGLGEQHLDQPEQPGVAGDENPTNPGADASVAQADAILSNRDENLSNRPEDLSNPPPAGHGGEVTP